MAKQYTRRRTDRKNPFANAFLAHVNINHAIFAVALLALYNKENLLTPHFLSVLGISGFILAFVGMGISVVFGRSRAAFVLLLLVISQLSFSLPAPRNLDPHLYYAAIYYFSAVLLPLNILILSGLKEVGFLSPGGRRRLGFIFFQVLISAVIIVSQDKEIFHYIGQQLTGSPFLQLTPLPLHAIIIIFPGIILLLWLKYNTPVDKTLVFCLAALALGFHFKAGSLTLMLTASVASLAVASVQETYAIAFLDELTGLPSRRLMHEELTKLGEQYTVAMIDIDFFKKINDSFGHHTGDDVLRLIATIITEEMTGVGKFFRYGGEEFIVFFPGKDIDDVLPRLENLRLKISKRKFVLRGKKDGDKKISVTVSIGVTQRKNQRRPEEVIETADKALYKAKDSGRNCVIAI